MGWECRASLASLWMVKVNNYYYSLKVRAEPTADRAPGVTWEEALQFCLRAGSFSSSAELEAPLSKRWQDGSCGDKKRLGTPPGLGEPDHARIGGWSPSSAFALPTELLPLRRALSSRPFSATWLWSGPWL